MPINIYFENTPCILNKIIDSNDAKNINITLANKIVHDFQAIENYDLNRLLEYRDFSFGILASYQPKSPLQQFQDFIQHISTLPTLSQSYLLAIASLNTNGYIREKALWRLADLNTQVALPFVLIRQRDWVYQVRRAANQCYRNSIWEIDLAFLTHFFKQSSTILFIGENDDLGAKTCFYDCRYLPQQTLPDILKELTEYENDGNPRMVDFLRFWMTRKIHKHLDNPLLFNYVIQSKNAKFRNEYIADMPISMINTAIIHHLTLLKKLPSLYASQFLSKVIENINTVEPSSSLESLIDHYIYKRNFSVEWLRVLKSNPDFDASSTFRDALKNGKIMPNVIRGLGEYGNEQDIETILPFIQHPRQKIRIATLDALYRLNYIEWRTIATELLTDIKYNVRKAAKYLLDQPVSLN